MNPENEVRRYNKRLESYKAEVEELKEENIALRQLLQCAAANIALLVKDAGKSVTLSKDAVADALCRYKLSAHRNESGDYVLEIGEV